MEPPSTFAVDVNVEDVTELYGWSIRMLFNPSILQVVDAELGTWLGDASGWGVWPFLSVRNDLGYVFCGQMLNPFENPTNGATGSGNLATITFQVIGIGVTTLELDPTALNTVIGGQNVPIDHNAEDGLFDNRPVIVEPNALFDVYGQPVEATPLTFDASGSNDNDDAGWIVSFEWDFDYDGMTFDVDATGMIATNAFAIEGTYTVALRVTDNDGLTDYFSTDVNIVVWMEGGDFPDLVGWEAKPEMPRLNEGPAARGMDLRSLVGNPTDGDYEVYVEFTLFSKDEAKELGSITTDTVPLGPGETLELTTYFDASDPMWRAFSGSPEWVGFGYYQWLLRKYIGFVSCYYKDSVMTDFEKGNVAKYISFNVVPMYHDIGILDVTASPTEVPSGGIIEIIVDVTNRGDLDESVDLNLDYVGIGGVGGNIGTTPVTLAPGENKTLTFTWDTTGLGPGPYLIKTKLPILPYEKAVGDNAFDIKIKIV
jgi:PKD repeat protein